MTSNVVVVPTGTANIASVVAAFRRQGIDPKVSRSPSEVDPANALVVPGVGTYGAAMDALSANNLVECLSERLEDGRATLAICVGFQIFSTSSLETPTTNGLGIVDAAVERLPKTGSVPQLGWNRVDASGRTRLVKSGWAYFAHSYRLSTPPEGWAASTVTHGETFVASIERGAVLGCQFHPELSGDWGDQLLGVWLATAKEAA